MRDSVLSAAGYLVCGQLILGCAVPLNRAKLSEADARARAVALANDQARQLFEVTPFTLDQGDIRFEASRWQWQSRVPVGKTEVEGRVALLADGAEEAVTVWMFAQPIAELPSERAPSGRAPFIRLDRAEPSRPAEQFKE